MAKVAKRNGRYVLDYYDNQGKRQRKTLKKGTTLKKAKTRLRDIEGQLQNGTYIPSDKVPIFLEIADDWLDYKRPNLRASVWSTYEGHTRNHFDEFKDRKINHISIADIEQYINTRQEQGMNISTLRKILVSLGQIFSYAVRHRYIAYNPVRDAERPKGQGKVKKKKIRILSPDEINTLTGREHQIHSISAWTLKPNRHFERVCAPDETHKSGCCNQA